LGAFARDAGVQDSAAFSRCNDLATPVPAIETDIDAAKAIGGTGTPTIVVNGLMLVGSPDSTHLDEYVRTALRASH
jgi:protein-disulfide isomerase